MAAGPDPIFSDPRLARIYDDVDGPRDDLDLSVDIAEELGATTVLDIGCGTGTLASRLALVGLDVTGVDPAGASLDVARSKPGAESVTWILGDAAALPACVGPVDLAVMTGNVAQVFTEDDHWHRTLRRTVGAIRIGGHFVFETRDPAQRAWESWDTGGDTAIVVTRHGELETWTSLLDVAPPLVTFRHYYRFAESDEVVTSDSTLRFRTRDELVHTLADAGMDVAEIRDAPDRPGLEFVVIARRSG